MSAQVAAGADAWNVFAPFGAIHLVTVLGCTALLAAIVLLAGRLRGPDNKQVERRARLALAVFALAYWIAYNTWWNWGGLDPLTGIPLQACDVSGLAAPFALLTRNRWLRATLYFWAFAFATQAFIQPTLTEGPAHVVFWAFWTAHTIILACAIYDLAVLGFRPDWGDFARAATVGLGWAAIVIPVDLWLGANYGYVGDPPAGTPIPPMVEAMGPWPGRLLIIFALAVLAFLLALSPWIALDRMRARASGDVAKERPDTVNESPAA